MTAIEFFLILSFVAINILLFRQNVQSKIIKDLRQRLDEKDEIEKTNKLRFDLQEARIDDLSQWCKKLEKLHQDSKEESMRSTNLSKRLMSLFQYSIETQGRIIQVLEKLSPELVQQLIKQARDGKNNTKH